MNKHNALVEQNFLPAASEKLRRCAISAVVFCCLYSPAWTLAEEPVVEMPPMPGQVYHSGQQKTGGDTEDLPPALKQIDEQIQKDVSVLSGQKLAPDSVAEQDRTAGNGSEAGAVARQQAKTADASGKDVSKAQNIAGGATTEGGGDMVMRKGVVAALILAGLGMGVLWLKKRKV